MGAFERFKFRGKLALCCHLVIMDIMPMAELVLLIG